MAKAEVTRSTDGAVVNYEERAEQARQLMRLCTDRTAALILRRLADDYAAMAVRERQKLEGTP